MQRVCQEGAVTTLGSTLHAPRPMCALPLHALASVAPARYNARTSVPMIAPMPLTRLMFHEAPSATGFGKEVGARMPVEELMAEACTPCTQFKPWARK